MSLLIGGVGLTAGVCMRMGVGAGSLVRRGSLEILTSFHASPKLARCCWTTLCSIMALVSVSLSFVVSMRIVPFVRPGVIFVMGFGTGPRELDEIESRPRRCD